MIRKSRTIIATFPFIALLAVSCGGGAMPEPASAAGEAAHETPADAAKSTGDEAKPADTGSPEEPGKARDTPGVHSEQGGKAGDTPGLR